MTANYRRFANRCTRIARSATNADEAKAFAAMARVWEKLAAEEEREIKALRFIDADEAPSGLSARRH